MEEAVDCRKARYVLVICWLVGRLDHKSSCAVGWMVELEFSVGEHSVFSASPCPDGRWDPSVSYSAGNGGLSPGDRESLA